MGKWVDGEVGELGKDGAQMEEVVAVAPAGLNYKS